MSDPSPAEIENLINHRLRIHKRVSESSGPHVIADCVSPGCPSPARHLYVNESTGMWDCKRCGASGSLWGLADLLGVRIRGSSLVVGAASVLMNHFQDLQDPSRDKQPKPTKTARGLSLDRLQTAHDRLFLEGDKAGGMVLDYLRFRGFDDSTIAKFKLCVSWIGKEPAVGIPYLEGDKIPLMKMRNLARGKEGRKFMRTKGSHSGIFNVDAIQDCDQVVLCEGEFDAISLWQMGITNVASTSLGAKKDLPSSWLLALAGARDIVLFYDQDDAGQEATAGLISQLGSHRCRIATVPDGVEAKDANDLLRLGTSQSEMRAIIDSAKPIENTSITTPAAYQDAVLGDIELGKSGLGLPTGWTSLDRLVRGWRPKELTVLTGHTGHGKSTWLFDAAYQLAKEGVPVLMSAFENGPESIARKVFRKSFGRAPSEINSEEELEEAIQAVRQLDRDPIYLMDFYGRKKLESVKDAITYAVYRLGVRHVVLDHLHFFLSRPAGSDEREHIDQVCMDLVSLTRELGIHIWLVVHPRGAVGLDVIPTGDSLKGSSTPKQVADLGLTVYRSIDVLGDSQDAAQIRDANGKKVDLQMGSDDALIYCWKARHDEAKEGATVLNFRKGDLSYSEPAGLQNIANWQDGEGADPFEF